MIKSYLISNLFLLSVIAHERDACHRFQVTLEHGNPPPLIVMRLAENLNLRHPMILPSPSVFDIVGWRDSAMKTGEVTVPHEQPTVMMGQLKKTSVFLDVGANIGLLSLAVSSMT